ncbi:hypothetical protein B0H14DRAFT_2627251 [Mycena olivaceomarginata]|nr:hypothetical protein B0H14DRAFT_2627251 [Mycena olivaceomarginata]
MSGDDNSSSDGKTLREGATAKRSDGKVICVPRVSLAEFCRDHDVDDTIRDILAEEGFKTARAVLEVSEDTLRTRLKIGQIGELKRGLREFISKAITGCDYHRDSFGEGEGLSEIEGANGRKGGRRAQIGGRNGYSDGSQKGQKAKLCNFLNLTGI